MKIKNEFFLTVVIFAIVLIIATASVILTNQRARFLAEQEQMARGIERGASELSYLFSDYILYRESTQRDRWESRYVLFSKELSTLHPETPEQKAVLNNIEDSSRRLKETFSSVVSAIESPAEGRDPVSLQAFIQIASSRMAVQSQGMVFDALRLSQMLGAQSDRLEWMNLLLVSFLLIVFSAYFLINYLIVYRRAWRSLATLRLGTRAVGSGNLDFKVKRERNDEIGEVVDAFNQMTTDLKAITASKADLENEIRERKRLEEELREANAGLEERVEERTQKIAIERQRLYDVLETLPAMICLLTPDYQISFANRSFREMFGESDSRHCYEYCFGIVKRCDFCEAYKVLETGEPHHWEVETPDGSSIIDVYSFPFTDADGSRMILEMGIDITGRKRAEAELKRHQEHLEELVRERTAEVQAASEAYKESRRAALNIMEDAVSARRQAEESAAELHRSLLRFELLAMTAGELLQSTKEAVIESICLKVMKHLDCDTFFNFLVDEQRGRMRLNAWAGITPEEVKQIEWLDYGEAICGWVAREGKPFIAKNIPATSDPRAELVKSCGIKAYACHPLLEPGERVIGTLSFGTKNRETFSEDDLSLMKAVADMVATGIDRMQAEQAVRESEARYQNLSRSLEETVKQKTAELVQAEHLAAIGQMVSVVAHEIRNPIQVIRTGVDGLRAAGQDAKERDEILEEIEYGARMVEGTVSDLLQYARPLKLEYASVTAGDVMEGALKLAANKLRNISVQVELEQSDEKMYVDSTKFTQVLANVISNAADAMPGGGSLRIRSRLLEGEAKLLEFAVTDTGEGIDQKHLGEIFKPFFTTKTRGTGLGLSLSKKIMDAHGGNMSITSKMGVGTTVVLTLPLRRGAMNRAD